MKDTYHIFYYFLEVKSYRSTVYHKKSYSKETLIELIFRWNEDFGYKRYFLFEDAPSFMLNSTEWNQDREVDL